MELVFGVLPDAPTFSLDNLDSVSAQLFFDLPDNQALSWLLNPRVELGGVINLRGRESYARRAQLALPTRGHTVLL
jgi:hypothetical protein